MKLWARSKVPFTNQIRSVWILSRVVPVLHIKHSATPTFTNGDAAHLHLKYPSIFIQISILPSISLSNPPPRLPLACPSLRGSALGYGQCADKFYIETVCNYCFPGNRDRVISTNVGDITLLSRRHLGWMVGPVKDIKTGQAIWFDDDDDDGY